MQLYLTPLRSRTAWPMAILALVFLVACTPGLALKNQALPDNDGLKTESHQEPGQRNELQALVQMGDQLRALGDYTRARSQYERALKIDGHYVAARLALADLLLHTQQTEQAAAIYHDLLHNQPSDSLVQKIGRFLGQPYEIIQITHGPGQHAFPDLAPDNKRLVCQADDNDNWDIYVLDLDGRNRTRITTHPARDEAPNWSPDAKTIAFTSTRDDSIHLHTEFTHREIYLYQFSDQSEIRLTHSSADNWAPVFAPKGNAILFESDRKVSPADSTGSDLFLLDRLKNTLTRITVENGIDGTASFINRKKILFASNRAGKFDIYTMSANGSHQARFLEFSGQNAGPRMDPQGKQVVFYAKVDDNFDLFLYQMRTGRIERMTFNPDIDAHPRFSPDGKRIYFHSRQSGKYQIYAILLEKPVQAVSLIAQLERMQEDNRKL